MVGRILAGTRRRSSTRSDFTNAFERQIGGKLDVRLREAKRALRRSKRIDGRLRTHFAEQIDRRGANIHVRVPFDYLDQPCSTSGWRSESRILTAKMRTSGSGSASRDRRTGATSPPRCLKASMTSLRSAASSLRRQSARPLRRRWIVQANQRYSESPRARRRSARASSGSPASLRHRDERSFLARHGGELRRRHPPAPPPVLRSSAARFGSALAAIQSPFALTSPIVFSLPASPD